MIQAKLKIGEPNDKFEQEADRVADEVMRKPKLQVVERAAVTGSASPTRIQRICQECEEELSSGPVAIQRMCPECEEELQRQPMEQAGHTPEVTPDVWAQINDLRGSGQPLSESALAFFEPRFGRDFGAVRVHTGDEAFALARTVQARAFTVGRDVVFGKGAYAPATASGRRLLAHELTHVAQQGNSEHVGTGEVAQTIQRTPADGDETLCEGAEFPAAAVWFSDPVLVRIRADEALMAFGSVGEPVALVQQAVVAWGCDEGLGHLLPKFGVDGIFGTETRGAVKTFQERQGIGVDGIVGPITMGELDRFIPGVFPTCPSGTEMASFVSASGAQTLPAVCLLPGIPPLKLTGVCGCKPEDFASPSSTTARVGDVCKAKKCAPALHGTKELVCLDEGDRVSVIERTPTVLEDGTSDVFLTVFVHVEPFFAREVRIRERFLEDCAPPKPDKKDEEEKCTLPHRVLKKGACGSGDDFAFFDFPNVPPEKAGLLASFRKMPDGVLKGIMEQELTGLAGAPGTQVFNQFVKGTGNSLRHAEKTRLGKLAKTAPSFVKVRQQVEQELLGQVKTMAQSGQVDFCKLKLAPNTVPLVNFRTKFFSSTGDPLPLHAVFGGTQGLEIELTSFSFDKAQNISILELRYIICDDFGVDLTDVTDKGLKALSEGLKAFWVLQHERKGNRPFLDLIDLTVPFKGSV